MRDQQVNIRLNEMESDMLDYLSETIMKMPKAEVIRDLIKKEYNNAMADIKRRLI